MASPSQAVVSPSRERFFVGANFHDAGPLLHYARSASREDYRWASDDGATTSEFELPRKATLGFRRIFWDVFDEVIEIERCQLDVRWLETDWTLHSVWAINSIDADPSVSLSERTNIFLFFELSPKAPIDKRYIYSKTFALGLNEQSSIVALLEAIRDLPKFGEFIASHRHIRGLPGRFIHHTESEATEIEDFICVLAFYSYCLLFIWQINRFQAAITMEPNSKRSLEQLSHVLRIRTHIINIDRHFLTTNITNDPLLKSQAKRIREQFQLKSKFSNFLTINQSIETYIATSSQLSAERRSKSINFIVLLFTTVSIPLALVQSILSFGAERILLPAGPINAIALVHGYPVFFRDILVLYVAALIVTWALVGFGFEVATAITAWSKAMVKRLPARLARIMGADDGPRGNQKKRIFSGAPPRRASTTSAARKSPPAT